jgi:hypothetical protein
MRYKAPSKEEISAVIARKQRNFDAKEANNLAAIKIAGENQIAQQKLQNAGAFANQQESNRGSFANNQLQETGATARQNSANANSLELAGRNNAANLVGEQLRSGVALTNAGVNPNAIGTFVNSARLPQSATQRIMNADLSGGVDPRPQGTMNLTIGGNGVRNNQTGQQVNTQAARLAGPPTMDTSGLTVPPKPVEQNWQSFNKITGVDANGVPQEQTLLVDQNSGRVRSPFTEQEQAASSVFDKAKQNRKPQPRRPQSQGLF